MVIQPYLFFDGRCDEAIEFYRQAVGAEVQMLMRYKDSPEPAGTPKGAENKIMHASLRIGNTTVLTSDGHNMGKPAFQGFALTLLVPNEPDAQRYFTALSADGKTLMPLTKTFFSPLFGMLSDRFGVMWMIYVEAASAHR